MPTSSPPAGVIRDLYPDGPDTVRDDDVNYLFEHFLHVFIASGEDEYHDVVVLEDGKIFEVHISCIGDAEDSFFRSNP
jgi:hypothetical protein